MKVMIVKKALQAMAQEACSLPYGKMELCSLCDEKVDACRERSLSHDM